jgi:CPA2 family monovalent cation:H+ antiporter-2
LTEFPLETLALVLAACAAVAVLTLRLRQSVIVGYLLAGALIGPHGLGWISGQERIEQMGEIGVVFLLFILGTDLSLERLRPLARPALIGGGLQVILTAAAAAGMASLYGWSWGSGEYLGCIVSLSSTAIVVKLLAASGELRAPQGKFALGVLLFQDLAVVPMMIFLPALGSPKGIMATFPEAAARATAFLALSFVAGKWLFPPLLRRVARSRSQELFTLTVIALALGTAVVSQKFGLSLGMGAFVAGLTLGQSPFSHKILADVLPFRDAFLSLFFVSIGMLLNWRAAAEDLLLVASLVALIVALKTFLSAGIGVLLGLPLGMAMHAGLALGQVGEFSFLLARMGREEHQVDDHLYMAIISASVVTMALTPALVKLGSILARRRPGPAEVRRTIARADREEGTGAWESLRDHVVICGYGPAGRLVASALEVVGRPFVVLELNPETVERARRAGVPVVYGDARAEMLLEKAGIDRARALVVAIPGIEISEGIVRNARIRCPDLPIYARAGFLAHRGRLNAAGATVTVNDEREAGLAIARAVLDRFGMEPAKAEKVLGGINGV